MAWETVARCDVCGRIKGDANKWLLMYHDFEQSQAFITFYMWDEKLSQSGGGTAFICGEECMHKRLQEFLDLRSKVVVESVTKVAS
jgi:hypothetical protein